jgi:hypothetical protein
VKSASDIAVEVQEKLLETFLRPGMTVDSSMTRWLIFSLRFRSARMWCWTHGADDGDPALLSEVLLVGRGDSCTISGTPPSWSVVTEFRMDSLRLGRADAALKFQLTG